MVPQVHALSIVDAIAQDLREKLFSGALPRDAQLTESDVASSYSIARPTAKAAIEKLVAEGLLSRGTHKTARVPALGAEDVRDLYFARTLIESEVVRRLAVEGHMPATAVAANNEVQALGASSDLSMIEPVVRFHYMLVSTLNSARMNRLFSSVMGEMRLCMAQMQSRRLLHASTIAEEHGPIIAAITSGDSDGAVQAMRAHLDAARDRLVLILERAPAEEVDGR
jgi:DNA-binding GntR family transcriptional regulator